MPRASKAWAISVSLHAAVLASAIALWRSTATAESADGISIDLVTLDDSPAILPVVAALPLPAVAADSNFTPVEFHQPIETGAPNPVAVKSLPHLPAVAQIATANMPRTGARFFGVTTTADSVVFVIDRSASMGMENRLGRAIAEVTASLFRLPPTATFQVVTYARNPAIVNRATSLIAVNDDSIAAARTALSGLRAEGGTDHVRALKTALLMAPQVIYFLTDEDDLSMADVKAITDYNRGRTCIHAICLVEPKSANSPMNELARRNRGQFRVAR